MLNELPEPRRSEILAELKQIERRIVVERPHITPLLVELGKQRGTLLNELYSAGSRL